MITKNYFYTFLLILLSGCAGNQQVKSPTYSQSRTPQEICYNKYGGDSDASICQSYWSSRDSTCDSTMSSILQSRGLKTWPRAECGTSRSSRSVAETPYMPASDNPKCEAFLSGLVSKGSPVVNACNARFKSLDDETIVCRQELNQFINSNSKGTGSNFATCGIPNDVLSSIAPLRTYNEFSKQGMSGISDYYKQFTSSVKSTCEKAAKNGSSDGHFCLALINKQSENLDAYYENLEIAAKLGNPGAQYELSNVFEKSKKPDELSEHKKWLMSAAVSGFPYAQVDVGWAFMDPKGTNHNYEKARYWNQKASDFGHGEGTSNLAMLFELGHGVTTNLTVAADLYRTAIYKKERAWSGQAEVRLGQMYQKGKGVPVDYAEAAKLYRRVLNDLPRASKEHKDQAIANLKLIER